MITLQEMSGYLISSYEELTALKDGDVVYSCEFDFDDDMHFLERDVADGGVLAPWADCSVVEIDLYYNGDHMVMVVDLS